MKRKDREAKPHPPEIAAALERLSDDDRENWVTMACIVWGDHEGCSGKIHDDSDVPAGGCKCPCHSIPREGRNDEPSA